MKFNLKIGLLISLMIFLISLFFYFQYRPPLVKEGLSGQIQTIGEESRPLKGAKGKAPLRRDSIKVKEKQTKRNQANLISFKELLVLKQKHCTGPLETFKELGDFFDSNSAVFMNKDTLIGKLDYILGEVYFANTKFRDEVQLLDYERIKKNELLRLSEVATGCSGAADVGIALASTLEAVKARNWSNEERKKAASFFIKLAESESMFDSWDALTKASGMILPILKESHPESLELKELRRFRAELLQEILTSRDLIRRSKNDSDARNFAEIGREKRSYFYERLDIIFTDSLDLP